MGFSQSRDGSGVTVVKVEGQLIVGNRQELKELVFAALDKGAAVARETTMERVVNTALAEPLRLRFFLGLLGSLALLLGAVGVYGVVSYAVARRRAEFGIRMALGAAPASVLAQVVRGDKLVLSDGELREVLQSQISYYAGDVAVIGWNAAFLYDSTAGAETSIQLLEYANSQLLEFRHYDDLLSGILDSVYDLLAQKTGFFARWGLARSATSLQTVLLDVAELTERADNAIKFLSDMFAARFYRLAANKVGVPDYKDLVAQKLKTAEDLHHDMVEQFNQSRAFFLEATVVAILLIELFYLFKGKP